MKATSWERTLVGPDRTIRDTLKCLDDSALQIAIVVDADRVLLGTVTDGDIRRAFLRGCTLTTPISAVMFPTPMVVTPQIAPAMTLHLMRANNIQRIPVVDAARRVVGLHLLDQLIAPRARPNLLFIMAGGFGRRLRPFTDNCPKPMLPVAGRPMLEHIVERARNEGFEHFVLSLHYLGDVIKNHFGDGSRFNVDIRYIEETEPLGTAGSLSLLDGTGGQAVVVTNGDVLTDIRYGDLLDFHSLHNGDATMAVRQHEWQHPFGVVRTDGLLITGLEEKPIHRSYINAGVYAFGPGTLSLLDRGAHCDIPAFYARIRDAGLRVLAFPMHEPWLDVGRPDDLAAADRLGDNRS